MRTAALLLILLPLIVSCASVKRASTIIDPKSVNKKKLQSLPTVTTPVNGFRVSIAKSLSKKEEQIVKQVDDKFLDFSECKGITDKGQRARIFLISVVEGTFECEFHGGRCNGEYDPANKLIIVNYKAFNRDGVMPLLKHEWAHAYGFLKPDDSNLDELKPCTKY